MGRKEKRESEEMKEIAKNFYLQMTLPGKADKVRKRQCGLLFEGWDALIQVYAGALIS